jgi:hypothetical protein
MKKKATAKVVTKIKRGGESIERANERDNPKVKKMKRKGKSIKY